MANSIPKAKWPGVNHNTPYIRRFPDSAYHKIVTKKAKFFGKLMYAALVAGGHPGAFRYDQLRHRTLESVLDSLLPNKVDFQVDCDISRYKKNDTWENALLFFDDIKDTLNRYTWKSSNSWGGRIDEYDGKASVTRLANACKNNKIYSIHDLEKMTKNQFGDIKGIGAFVVMACEEYLKRKGTSFSTKF